MDGNKKLYEIKELIKIIPLSRAGIYAAIAKGFIPSQQIGKRVFVPAWYVESLVEPPQSPLRA